MMPNRRTQVLQLTTRRQYRAALLDVLAAGLFVQIGERLAAEKVEDAA